MIAGGPSGACILYANGCGLNETALRLVWQILEQGGSRTKSNAGEDEGDIAEEDTKGQYRLVDWRTRAQRQDGLGESRAGRPAPLIDRFHRLMFLLFGNRAAELQENFENWGLAAEPAFLPLIQALHSLADRERRPEEKKLIEAVAAQLKLNRRTVVEAGVVREESTLEDWAARADSLEGLIPTDGETNDMSRAAKNVIVPWNKPCNLRQEIRDRELGEADFAVDLNKVIFGVPRGPLPFYCDPVQFFATSYATANLGDFCRAVLRRLAGEKAGEAIINVSQTFGGGKSHTLTTLYYFTVLGGKLPRGDNTVEQILNNAQLDEAPAARVAAVSFDHVDWKDGGRAKSPDGEVRRFRMPWNLIAWRLLGTRGLEIVNRDETETGYDTPPSDELWSQLLAEANAGAALILLDEFLMWAHDAASPESADRTRGPVWYERLKNFFQRLSQAVASSQRSCLVVSLLATEPTKVDEIGREILAQCNNGLGRVAQDRAPVEKNDLPELLRHRLFSSYPQTEADKQQHVLAFWPRFEAMDPTRARQPAR